MTDLPIREAGVYPDIDAESYHADPVEGGSLSSSGARKLLPPGCPALFHWERHNPPEPKRHFDIGHAAHKLVLGVGPTIVDTGLDNRRGNAWKDAEKTCREQGTVPLLSADYEMVHAMAQALQYSEAGELFEPGTFDAELVIVWRHNLGWDHIWRRAMIDLLPHDRGLVVDYKSCESADPSALQRAMHNYGYAQQADYYLSGLVALELVEPDTEFRFVCQEKTAPYLVTMFTPDAEAMATGRARNAEAMRLYAECTRTGIWPGYVTGVVDLSLPRWAQRAEDVDE